MMDAIMTVSYYFVKNTKTKTKIIEFTWFYLSSHVWLWLWLDFNDKNDGTTIIAKISMSLCTKSKLDFVD
jgi:hypothetical protein